MNDPTPETAPDDAPDAVTAAAPDTTSPPPEVDSTPTRPSLAAWLFAAGNLGIAALALGGIFGLLTVRWWVVDVPAAVGGLLLLLGAVGLAARPAWGWQAARAAALFTLAIGLSVTVALILAAGYVHGVHGVLGKGVSIAYVLLVAAALPWLIAFPTAQLVWLGAQRGPGR